MRNMVLLLAMMAAGIAGYSIGGYQGRQAKAALASVAAAAEQAGAEREKAIKDLGDKLKARAADYEREKIRINEEHQKQRATWAWVVAGRDKRIKELVDASAGIEGEIERRRGLMGNAADSDERQQLKDQMALLEAQLREQQTYVAGLECSKVRVPREMLNALTGGMP